MILIGVAVLGTAGGWLGAALSDGNWFSGWSILLGTLGSFAGIWAGYRAGRSLDL